MKPQSTSEDAMKICAFSLRYDPIALRMVMAEADITILGYFYAVDFGPHVRPCQHRVGKNAICTCYLGELCPAVEVVRAYLANGGEQTPEPPPGYYPVFPLKCPICHSKVTYDNTLSSNTRGAGWRCVLGGSAHYWERMVQVTAWKFACKRAIQQGSPPPEPLPADFW
jgi:hypothetical protein